MITDIQAYILDDTRHGNCIPGLLAPILLVAAGYKHVRADEEGLKFYRPTGEYCVLRRHFSVAHAFVYKWDDLKPFLEAAEQS